MVRTRWWVCIPSEKRSNGFAGNDIRGFSICNTIDIRLNIFIAHHRYILLEQLFIRAPLEKPFEVLCVCVSIEYLVQYIILYLLRV